MNIINFFFKYGLLIGAILVLASCGSMPKVEDGEFDCVTPLGNITISGQTDSDILFDAKTLKATRGGVTAQIPFSQCIYLRKVAK